MNKFIVSSVFVLSLLGATIASAQAYNYYPSTSVAPSYTAACPNITSDLSVGSKGAQVSALQTFLVAQNYPGGGSWMITGYFGTATQQAVKIFQGQRGLYQSGMVDAATRAAMCGMSGQGGSYNYGYNNTYTYPNNSYTNTYNPFNYNAYPYNYNSQYPYTYNNTYPYNYNYNNYNYPYTNYYSQCGTSPYFYPCINNSSAPTLTSLSTTSGAPGSSVTAFGTNFDYSSNTVYVGGRTLTGIPSYNGTTLTFTIPSNASGQVSVSVGNSRGTSNALTFQVFGGTGCLSGQGGTYPYSSCGCGGYGYGYNCPPPVGPISLSYLSPTSGAVGTAVTVYGWGFSSTGNTVHFGNGIITNLTSFDGRSVSFTVPATLTGYGYQPIGLGTYDVSVSNSAGATSNTLPFSITSLNTSGTLSIGSVNGPTTLSIGQLGTWTINVNTQGGTQLTASVRWGDENLYNVALSAPQSIYGQGTNTATFTHAYLQTGTYTVTFTASNNLGQSNAASATVSVGGTNTNTISLSSLVPLSGHVGTQVMLQGSGFSQYDNTVHFGVGGTMHVPSFNGTTIYYTIPSSVSPCDVIQTFAYCAQYIQPITPGPYPVYVTSGNGTSQTLQFLVN